MRRRRADDLFERVATFEALCAAAWRAVTGKRRTPAPAAFLANLEPEVLRLERELRAGTWRPGGYVSFEIRDPKRRLISAAPFRDRVVHHAVHAVIAPLFERGFIEHTYANRVDKGTHRAVARYERLRDRYRYVLRGDIYRYFPAIDHEVLKSDLRRRIACPPTLSVLDRIIDASNPQEPVHLYYPGDDLFTPYERRRGLPIGNAELESLNALTAPDPRLEQVLEVLERIDLPGAVCDTLRRELRRTLASRTIGKVVDRAQCVLRLPWRRRSPARFDASGVSLALERAHGGCGRARARLVEALGACPQSTGLLTMEGPRDGRGVAAAGSPLALVVRPTAAAPVPCLAGPSGTGKTSLAVGAAAALGRAHVQVALDVPDLERLLHGIEDVRAGRIVEGLCEADVNNPVFVLEGIDRVDDEAAGVLLDVLEPRRRRVFKDAYLDVPFDLSDALWIVTATDAGKIPAPVRKWLAVIELPGYSTEEKLDIAQRYLLTRPFAARSPASWLSPEPSASAAEPAASPTGPAVVSDVSVSPLWEQESSPPSSAPPAAAGEDWRLSACTGAVGFEPSAIRRVIEDHTDEAGVSELSSKLSAICRRVVERHPTGRRGPAVVTPAVVREVLGDGETLPAAVRAAIARERRRLAGGSADDAARTNDWIEWLETLPWTRRSEAASDLAGARAALDAGHAGLDEAKSRILEYLAVRRRNPRSGAVLCLAGAPGVGKTSLAQCTARALGRGFVKLACGGLRDESDLRGHNRTWRDSQPGWILRELRRVGSRDPVFVLDELDKIGSAPAAVLLEVLDPQQHKEFRDAFVELPFDLSEVLFITTANEVSAIPAALRDRLEVLELAGYSEDEKVSIARTHLVAAENRAAGLSARPVRFTAGALRRIISEHTSEQGVRELARCLRTVCRKVALGLETGDASLVRERITARQVHAFLGAPSSDRKDELAGLRARLAAPTLPAAVRERGRQVLARLSAWSPADPEHVRAREYLQCLEGVPWTVRAAPTVDLSRARALLDGGHASHAAVKERLLDYVAVRLSNPGVPSSSLLCLLGAPGVGKSSLARLVASALGRPCAWVNCGGLGSASALHGARGERPGRVVEELRRVGVRNPVFVLDEIDRLDETGAAAAALLAAVDPPPGAGFRDRYLDLSVDLSEALFVATASNLGSVPALLRERMRVVELPGYAESEKREIATRYLLPGLLRLHGLSADQVEVSDEAVGAIIGGYTREAGVWRLTAVLDEVCAKVVRRRAEGDTSAVEVTPAQLAGLLGAPRHRAAEVAGRTGRPGVAVGLCCTTTGAGEASVIEASRMAGSGALTLTGGLGKSMQESARAVLSWLRANAERYGVDPDFPRDTDIHLHVDGGPGDGTSGGVTMAAALVSVMTGRVVRGDVAMSGEVTLSGQVLPVGGIAEKLLAAHRCGLAGVILPRGNEREVDEEVGEALRRAVEVHYVTRVDELLDLALEPATSSAAPAGRVS